MSGWLLNNELRTGMWWGVAFHVFLRHLIGLDIES